MTADPTPGATAPIPHPAPPPGADDEAAAAVDRLEATPVDDLDAVLAAGEAAHRALQERLRQTAE